MKVWLERQWKSVREIFWKIWYFRLPWAKCAMWTCARSDEETRRANDFFRVPIWVGPSALAASLDLPKHRVFNSPQSCSLTFSDQISFDELPLKKKIGFLVWFALVYILSAVFRILTLALLFDWDLFYPCPRSSPHCPLDLEAGLLREPGGLDTWPHPAWSARRAQLDKSLGRED